MDLRDETHFWIIFDCDIRWASLWFGRECSRFVPHRERSTLDPMMSRSKPFDDINLTEYWVQSHHSITVYSPAYIVNVHKPFFPPEPGPVSSKPFR